jgi:hypothetical protein
LSIPEGNMEKDPGPYLVHAIMYKLQVMPHLDGLDGGLAASFPMGLFTGGEMYWSDLQGESYAALELCKCINNEKFSYCPGHMCIYFAQVLYHTVEEWNPLGGMTNEKITPGRIGHVFFSPDQSVKALFGKEPGWASHTAGGTVPSAV